MGELVERKIESIRSILDELVADNNATLYEGEILEVSKQLDDLIAIYYEESSI